MLLIYTYVFPGGRIWPSSLNLIQYTSVFVCRPKRVFFYNNAVLGGTVASMASICLRPRPCMRGAKTGVSPPLRPPCKYMCRYFGHVVSAIIEKSDLDQVLSRRRLINSWRWVPPFSVLFARCASLCSSLPTLQGSASTVLASSPCGGCSSRFCGQNIKLFFRTYRYK